MVTPSLNSAAQSGAPAEALVTGLCRCDSASGGLGLAQCPLANVIPGEEVRIKVESRYLGSNPTPSTVVRLSRQDHWPL